jgi:hypothetical protein
MSRKTLMTVIGFFGVVLTFLQAQFGLSIDTTAILAGLTAILTYVFFEAKLDLKKFVALGSKWKDPKFWIAFASTALVAVNESFGLGIPVEMVIGTLTLIMGLLFGKDFKNA